jgi:hypothetical protein
MVELCLRGALGGLVARRSSLVACLSSAVGRRRVATWTIVPRRRANEMSLLSLRFSVLPAGSGGTPESRVDAFGEEVVDRIRRSAVATHRLERKRLQGRACCRRGCRLALGPCGVHQGVVARIVRRWVWLVSERVAVCEVLVGSAKGVGGGDVDMPVLGVRVVDGRDVRNEDVRLHIAIEQGLGLGCRDVRVGVQVVDEDRLNVLVRLAALVGLAAVGHQMRAKPHLDPLVALRVPATMRARCMRLVVVAGQRRSCAPVGLGRQQGLEGTAVQLSTTK